MLVYSQISNYTFKKKIPLVDGRRSMKTVCKTLILEDFFLGIFLILNAQDAVLI